MVEKHELPKYGLKNDMELDKQPPTILEEAGEVQLAAVEGEGAVHDDEELKNKQITPRETESVHKPNYNSWQAVSYLLFTMKALTPLLVSFTNGFVVAGES